MDLLLAVVYLESKSYTACCGAAAEFDDDQPAGEGSYRSMGMCVLEWASVVEGSEGEWFGMDGGVVEEEGFSCG